MDQAEQKKAQLEQLEKEFSDSKKKFSNLGKEKEAAFAKMRTFSTGLKSLNQKLDALKKERDQLTQKVRTAKKERTAFNKQVKDSSTVLRAAREGSPGQSQFQRRGRYDKKEKTVAQMKKEIESLETKLETEPMKFSIEKSIKKTIKLLKSEISKKKESEENFAAAKTAGKEFHTIRKQAESSHKQVQEFAELSQEKHEAMQKILDEIKDQRKAREPISKEYLEKKGEWTTQKKVCDDLAKQIKELKDELGMQSQKNRKEQAKEKAKEVEEKIKKGGKLTTEDILAMQAMKD